MLFDLCNQIQWALCQEELKSAQQVSEGWLRIGYSDLFGSNPSWQVLLLHRRRPGRYPRKGVIAGATDSGYAPLRLFWIPILAEQRTLWPSRTSSKSIRHQGYPLEKFTLDETVRYFQDMALSREATEESSVLSVAFPATRER